MKSCMLQGLLTGFTHSMSHSGARPPLMISHFDLAIAIGCRLTDWKYPSDLQKLAVQRCAKGVMTQRSYVLEQCG